MKDIVYELQDLRHLTWTRTRKSSGTAGSFLGSSSTLENARMVPKSFLQKLPKPAEKDLNLVFAGLDGILSETHLAKMREIIRERWYSLDRI